MRKNLNIITLVALVATLFSSCQVVGDIFKAGIGVGIFIVVFIIIIIVWLISRFRK